MPSNLPTVEGYDPNRRTTLCLTDEALDRVRTLEAQRDELLAALEALTTDTESIYLGEPEKYRSIWLSARAAIRKAKGESS